MADEYQDLADTHEQTRAKCATLVKENKLLRNMIDESAKFLHTQAAALHRAGDAFRVQKLVMDADPNMTAHSYQRFLNDQHKPNGDPLPANILH